MDHELFFSKLRSFRHDVSRLGPGTEGRFNRESRGLLKEVDSANTPGLSSRDGLYWDHMSAVRDAQHVSSEDSPSSRYLWWVIDYGDF